MSSLRKLNLTSWSALVFSAAMLLIAGCAQTGDDTAGTSEDQQSALSLPAIHEAHTLAEAKTLAAELSKPILVDFFAEWCGPCKRFAAAKEEDADIRTALDGVVFLTIDSEKGDGVTHAQTYEVRVYPSFVLIDATGETIARWAGYGKDGFIANLNESLQDLTPITGKQARFEANPTAADAAALGSYHDARGEAKEAVDFYRLAQKFNEDKDRDYSFAVFQNISQGMRSNLFNQDELKRAAADVMKNGKNIEEVLWVAMMMHQRALSQDDLETSSYYLDAALSRTKGNTEPTVQAQRKELLAEHALFVLKDEAKAIEYKKETLSADWLTSDSELNSFAWWCFEREINLEEAEAMARSGVEVAAAGRAKAMILDTLADICSARGNQAEAIAAVKLAIEQEPDNDYYTRQLTKFQERLAGNN
jgi:thiol-disulfide isomerase/thioredoxin